MFHFCLFFSFCLSEIVFQNLTCETKLLHGTKSNEAISSSIPVSMSWHDFDGSFDCLESIESTYSHLFNFVPSSVTEKDGVLKFLESIKSAINQRDKAFLKQLLASSIWL